MSELSFSSRLARLRGFAERKWGLGQLWVAYYFAQDETTRRIKKAMHDNPWAVYPGSRPESGKCFYSSLKYDSPETARDAFAIPNRAKIYYARDATPDGHTLTKALLQIDTAAADGRVTAHGMGAIAAALTCVRSGEHIVASKFLFGTTKAVLDDLKKSRNIDVTYVDGRDPAAWEAAAQDNPNTRAFFFEPVGNPGMESVDVKAVSAIAHKPGRTIFSISDNAMTPFDQSLTHGADIVAFSTTKLLGLGVENGGAIIASQTGLKRLCDHFECEPVKLPVFTATSRMGLMQSHRSAKAMLEWVGPSFLRMQKQTATAVKLVRGLVNENPALGGMIRSTALEDTPEHAYSSLFAIDLGSQENAFRFIKSLQKQGIILINNFGSARTSVTYPSATTQFALSPEQQLAQGVTPGLVRISIGLESVGFLQEVFMRALSDASEKQKVYTRLSRKQLVAA